MMKVLALALLLAVVSAAPLLHHDGLNVIPGHYIVVLREGLSNLDRDAHISVLQDRILELNAAQESEVKWRYGIGAFVGFSARLSKQVLQEQLAHSNVQYIEADQVMSISHEHELEVRTPEAVVTQNGATWGLARTSKRQLPLATAYLYNSIAGSGITVYVIDTGILTTHTDFGTRATSVFNAITGESSTDLNGHGTHCAGTIGGTTYGIAKQVQLRGVKVLSASGSGSNAGVIAGVDYVTNAAGTKKVASMSLGGGASSALDDAVTKSINSGVTYAIAAGNSNADACTTSPARVAAAITVGATQNNDARASYSNYGACLNIFAPGTSITSDWIGSNTATNTISGTSMATPHVAGVIALILSEGAASTPAAVKTTLINWGTSGVITSPGSGSPNVLLFSNPN